ncbi:MAG: TetR/AcrR family transcriptional regulator [Oscillospiraceae bacterium]|nr:TetR/AcrR family transcriptional regulator [Oscillospiraceae bacterium]
MKGKKGEKRKQELLKIAYRMFISKGYEETSIDEIIAEAHIAKGTYYYHFSSKEELLEEVISMMISEEVRRAREVLAAPLPVPQKLVGVIVALRPVGDESNIADALNQKENIIMHEKISRRVVEEAVPLLGEVVSEGIEQGMFTCDHIPERVRMILIMSQHLFDSGNFTQGDIEVFIDMVEKTLGAPQGTLGFIRRLVSRKEQ